MSQVRRRHFLVAAGAGGLSVILPALAQQERRVRRIGYFSPSTLATNAAWLAAFREGMAELGWIEGRDYAIDARYADGIVQAFEGLATDSVAAQPDLLLTVADTTTRLLAQRTKTIPIVFATILDPLVPGVVATLQRPGGNATGLTSLARELSAKRLQVLKEAFPRVAHVVMLYEPAVAGIRSHIMDTEEAAKRLRMRITQIDWQKATDIEPAFKRGAALGAEAYLVSPGILLTSQQQAIVARSVSSNAPVMFPDSEFVESGGLMSYGASWRDNYRRAAAYVDRILKGAKPGDLPVEQPTKFELVVNLRTARAMGVRFPQSILVRADRVIE